ncbi:hypothetical protein [Candidatus Collinsella stercoripullorum]|uniref:hypothetical protein n=1 Tax=Candidatus Collinsella stercoripullorum TaxID=2838522 RepID=UPI0022E21B3E|nr:hypothetical protein [Candidatus Collinsella stercoripullorum]
MLDNTMQMMRGCGDKLFRGFTVEASTTTTGGTVSSQSGAGTVLFMAFLVCSLVALAIENGKDVELDLHSGKLSIKGPRLAHDALGLSA